MSTETDQAAARKAQDLYRFDGSDPDMILALRSAFRAGAEFAAPAPDPSCARCHLTKREHQVGYSASRCTYIPDPAPAPAPSVVPEAAVTAFKAACHAADTEGRAGERVRDGLAAALPFLTAAPSTTCDEVARALFAADPAHDYGADEFDRLRGLRFDVAAHYVAQADALLARFTITPKEDR